MVVVGISPRLHVFDGVRSAHDARDFAIAAQERYQELSIGLTTYLYRTIHCMSGLVLFLVA